MQAIAQCCRSRTGSRLRASSRTARTLGDVSGLLATEAAIGIVYAVVGLPLLLRIIERREPQARDSLEIA